MAENRQKRKLPSWMKGRASEVISEQKCSQPKKSLLDLPILKFDGSIVYSHNKNDCALICQDIRNSLNEASTQVVGFDIEWPVTYQTGKEPKTALIQICMTPEKCYLFHVSCMPDLPSPLKDLLLDHRLVKAGVGIESDFWKLGRDFDVDSILMIRNGMVNLTQLANEVLGCKENWSLDSMCRHVIALNVRVEPSAQILSTKTVNTFPLGKSLDKDASVRKSDWSQYPLSELQTKYAALDAYAGLMLYKELMERKKKVQK